MDKRKEFLRRLDAEERKALEFLDQTERDFFEQIQRAKEKIERGLAEPGTQNPMAHFDGQKAEAEARFAETRENIRNYFLDLREGRIVDDGSK